MVKETLGLSYGAKPTKVLVSVGVSITPSLLVSTKLSLVPVFPAGLYIKSI